MKNLLMATTSCLLLLLGAVTLPAASKVTALQAKDSGQEIQVKAGAIIELFYSFPESPASRISSPARWSTGFPSSPGRPILTFFSTPSNFAANIKA
jgi:hypothetical protein